MPRGGALLLVSLLLAGTLPATLGLGSPVSAGRGPTPPRPCPLPAKGGYGIRTGLRGGWALRAGHRHAHAGRSGEAGVSAETLPRSDSPGAAPSRCTASPAVGRSPRTPLYFRSAPRRRARRLSAHRGRFRGLGAAVINACPQPHLKAGGGDASVVCSSKGNYFAKQVVLLSCQIWRVWGQTWNFWKLPKVHASF